mmetsp:Transcript_44676/g.140093  ORF Transcript_44676/g.140093 Transcript_44676/m.140093 type:complete len:516 (-) Transcript_44676:59-1606(-)
MVHPNPRLTSPQTPPYYIFSFCLQETTVTEPYPAAYGQRLGQATTVRQQKPNPGAKSLIPQPEAAAADPVVVRQLVDGADGGEGVLLVGEHVEGGLLELGRGERVHAGDHLGEAHAAAEREHLLAHGVAERGVAVLGGEELGLERGLGELRLRVREAVAEAREVHRRVVHELLVAAVRHLAVNAEEAGVLVQRHERGGGRAHAVLLGDLLQEHLPGVGALLGRRLPGAEHLGEGHVVHDLRRVPARDLEGDGQARLRHGVEAHADVRAREDGGVGGHLHGGARGRQRVEARRGGRELPRGHARGAHHRLICRVERGLELVHVLGLDHAHRAVGAQHRHAHGRVEVGAGVQVLHDRRLRGVAGRLDRRHHARLLALERVSVGRARKARGDESQRLAGILLQHRRGDRRLLAVHHRGEVPAEGRLVRRRDGVHADLGRNVGNAIVRRVLVAGAHIDEHAHGGRGAAGFLSADLDAAAERADGRSRGVDEVLRHRREPASRLAQEPGWSRNAAARHGA